MDAKYSKLLKNTVIFSVGEFASKILNFLIVPLYTYVLTTEEYGRIDLFTTTISFLVPIMTLQIQEAMLRFLLGKEIDKETAVSNCWAVFLGGSVFALALYPGYLRFFGTRELALIFTVSLLLTSFSSIFTHYLRAVGRNVEYALKGVLGTFVNLSCNVLLVLVLRWGLRGYRYAGGGTQIFSLGYLLLVGGIWKHLNLRHLRRDILKNMLRYSIPLIPNTLMWWIMSAGDKYIINWFLGDSANGLYSLALKIPTIVSLFYAFFYQAWQMSAIEENDTADRNAFYNRVYKLTNALLILLVSGIILCIKPLYVLVMSERFAPAWEFVPLLALGTAFSCQASFFGVVYTTTKKTAKVFYTTGLGAVFNLLFNFLLIRPLGLQGVAIGTCLGYVATVCIRAYDTRKEITMDFDFWRLGVSMGILLGQIYATIRMRAMFNWVGAVCFAILIVVYHSEFLGIVNVVRSKLKKSRKY